jgi:hypothetical protein
MGFYAPSQKLILVDKNGDRIEASRHEYVTTYQALGYTISCPYPEVEHFEVTMGDRMNVKQLIPLDGPDGNPAPSAPITDFLHAAPADGRPVAMKDVGYTIAPSYVPPETQPLIGGIESPAPYPVTPTSATGEAAKALIDQYKILRFNLLELSKKREAAKVALDGAEATYQKTQALRVLGGQGRQDEPEALVALRTQYETLLRDETRGADAIRELVIGQAAGQKAELIAQTDALLAEIEARTAKSLDRMAADLHSLCCDYGVEHVTDLVKAAARLSKIDNPLTVQIQAARTGLGDEKPATEILKFLAGLPEIVRPS